MKTAILVDGGFYRKMARKHFGEKDPSDRVQELVSYCKRHLKQVDNFVKDEAGNKQFLYSDLYHIYQTLQLKDVKEKDFSLSMYQKGVDMKIGLDIATLSYKKLVDQIVLISGDSDFVPAAKLARLEGIDFILDPMGHSITESLQEHIDGLRSYYSVFAQQNSQSEVIS